MPTPTRRFYSNTATQQQTNGQINSTAATVTISGSFAGWSAQFPFFATLDIGTASEEVVLVTGIAGTTATISRGQDGTIAMSHAAGATFDQTVVRQDLDEANAHTSSNTGVHGVNGQVVGTTDPQILTNKTLTSPTINGFGGVGDGNISGNLSVSNTTTVGTLAVVSNETVAGTLSVTGTTTLSDDTSLTGNLAVTGNATVSGTLTADGVIDSSLGNFIAIPLASGYSPNSFGWVPAYRKNRDGSVDLRGGIQKNSGALVASVTIATLPSGFRPAAIFETVQAATSSGGTGWVRLQIGTDGIIQISVIDSNSNATWVSLDNIKFWTA